MNKKEKIFKYKIYKNKIYKKTISGKWKEIPKMEYIRKIEKNKKVMEETLNFNLFKFLNDKYEVDFYNGKSTFQQEIKCSIIKWEENFVETYDNCLCGDLLIGVKFQSAKTNKIISTTYYKMFIKIDKKISKKLIELMFDRAYSGSFENPWLEEEIYQELKSCNIIKNNSSFSYCCNICNQKFDCLKELLSHSIECKHKNEIINSYKNYPEIQNIIRRM